MKKARNVFFKNLPYLCLVGVIGLGLMTIVGTGRGGPTSLESTCPYSGGWIRIDYPTTEPTYTTIRDEIRLSGSAFISSKHARCCTGSAEDTGVWVMWENETSGASGSAGHSAVYCWIIGYFLCGHDWGETIPLVEGDNHITVIALDPSNVGGCDSITVTSIHDTTPPSIPTNLTATSMSSTEIDLSWYASTDDVEVEGYKVYRDGIHIENTTTTSFSDTGLSPGTQYCYTISAYDTTGNESAQSSEACATTLDVASPSVPTNLIAIVVSSTEIALSWDASTDDVEVEGYKVYRDGIHIENTTTTSFSDTGLISETRYCYTVSAYDAAGNESPQSSEACATTSWATYSIDSAVNITGPSSIAVDSMDKVHIIYCDFDNPDIKYATNVSGAWVIETISQGNMGGSSSIAVDSMDKVHISYRASGLKYATNASGGWFTETIDSGGSNGLYSSIAVDSMDKVHISYFDYTNHDIKYATNASGGWFIETIEHSQQGDVGSCTSMAVDSMDKVHISYCSYTNHDLKYATNVSGAWVIETIDSQGDVGLSTSIAVDSLDKVHISYFDYTYGLKYATNVSGAWVIETIDSQGDVGRNNSIAVDSADSVHISYYDWSNGELKYATNVSGAWVAYIIDTARTIYVSIAMDSSDKVHISYHGTELGLMYATNR